MGCWWVRSGRWVVAGALALALAGCASVEALDNAARGGPVIYGGTRLDLVALEGNPYTLARYRRDYGLSPPAYPALDLPCSFLLDTALLPGTLVLEGYRWAVGY